MPFQGKTKSMVMMANVCWEAPLSFGHLPFRAETYLYLTLKSQQQSTLKGQESTLNSQLSTVISYSEHYNNGCFKRPYHIINKKTAFILWCYS